MEGVEQEDQKIRRFGDGSGRAIGALIEVHRNSGPGLLESAYEACFCRELHILGIPFERQLLGAPVGLLVNFDVPSLRQGLRRLSVPPPTF